MGYPIDIKRFFATSVAALVLAFCVAAPAQADPSADTVRNSLLVTDALVESGRFTGTATERGFFQQRRVISDNTIAQSFDMRSPTNQRLDVAAAFSFAQLRLRFVYANRKIYSRSGRRNYFVPLTKREWRQTMRHTRSKSLPVLVDLAMGLMTDWRDDGPAVSDGVAIENYSAAVEFPALVESFLPGLDEIIYDGSYALYFSDPKDWKPYTPTSVARPRVTFGVDATGILRRVHVEAPQSLSVEGFELVGDFELTDVNEPIAIKVLKSARRMTKKNADQYFGGLFGASTIRAAVFGR